MLIAQITDLHIGLKPASEMNIDRLRTVVERLVEHSPDLILISGDLTDGGGAAAYAQLKALLAPLQAPTLLAIGNHDQREVFIASLPDTPVNEGFVQYATNIGGLRIVVLDTVEAGRHDGAFCERRASWLARCLDEQPTTPTLIVLHHPPVKSGIDWMDGAVPGPWTDRLEAVLSKRAQVVGMVAGHIHRPFVSEFSGHRVVVAASSAPQLVLDLTPDDESMEQIPRIIAEDPGYAMHVWTGRELISHFGTAKPHRVIASLNMASGEIVPE